MSQCICYIQARGGSKRFPGKNVALWNGIPLVEDAIKKAQACGLFDLTAVSSDSVEILGIAARCGVLPLWRTPETSNDTATDNDVAREVLRYFPDAEMVCKLYPCVPLLTSLDILELYKVYCEFSAVVGGAFYVDENGIDTGSAYIFNRNYYERIGNLHCKEFKWFPMQSKLYQDINTPEDLEIAKMKAEK